MSLSYSKYVNIKIKKIQYWGSIKLTLNIKGK